ncbi:MAG TPA: hypothetical protein VHK91_07890 [Flavisolibacter sp.]|jgi:hypothetical protein|nr:hypothetical protein [Flavisolibacter sp.]
MKKKPLLTLVFLAAASAAWSQSNSPYSRYGLGDLLPNNNITSRGMGGLSAGYADVISVNFTNPASYSSFFALKEKNSNKLQTGRVILDAGINIENRTLIAPNTTQRFTSSDVYFSYLQVGIPLRKNWGLSFGLRPLSRISYRINRVERLTDPVSGNYIDTALTQFTGSGGSFLPSIGTGFAIGNLSLGVNGGFLFGKKETGTLRNLIDTIQHAGSNYTNDFSFGGLYYNAGLQYKINLKKDNYIRLGLAVSTKQTIKGSQDQLRQTYTTGSAGEIIQIDSVYRQSDVKGEIVYPASYTAGFVVGNDVKGWVFGADYIQNKWSDYRFFGQTDSVQDSWKVQAGAQFRPTPGTGYFSRLGYRVGFYAGTDYIRLDQKLPIMGASFGLAIPVRPSRMAPNQFSTFNLAFEYGKRGNNDNRLKENLFRLSVGFSFTDLWFTKRKYD